MFPTGTVVLAAAVRNHVTELYPSEQRYVDAAVEKRRAEFSTGRILTARALNVLGVPEQPILKGAHNEPIWPVGIVGSISHSSQTCIVALAFENVSRGVGIDVETSDARVSNLEHLILREDERDEVLRNGSIKGDELVRLTFSAKESVFKAVFAQVQRFIEFEEIRLVFDTARQTFTATAPNDERLNEIVTSGKGGHVSYQNLLVTGFFLPGSESNRS